MLVHTVLKLIDDAITATYTSSGASSGTGTSSTCRLRRGSLSAARQAFEHVLVFAAHEHRPRGARHGNLRQRLARGAREHGV